MLKKNYISSAIVQKEVIKRLIDRMSLINILPSSIIDIGSGVGLSSEPLLKSYTESNLIMYDHSVDALKNSVIDENERVNIVCGEFKSLPFENDSFDIVFSSSSLHWEDDINLSFSEIYKILKPGGLFFFSTYGPDTLTELRSAWESVDNRRHVNDFYDMHDIADLMLNLEFMDTVVDSERIIIKYDSVTHIQKDLKNIGSHITKKQERSGSLYSKGKMEAMYREYENFRHQDGLLPVTYEVIYGHGWKKVKPLNLKNVK